MRKNESTRWKVLKQLFNILNFWVCTSFPYTENWNWLQWKSLSSWYIFSKIPRMFCNEFQNFKTTFLKLIQDNIVWAWIDNFKYQILALQNQKVADEK